MYVMNNLKYYYLIKHGKGVISYTKTKININIEVS